MNVNPLQVLGTVVEHWNDVLTHLKLTNEFGTMSTVFARLFLPSDLRNSFLAQCQQTVKDYELAQKSWTEEAGEILMKQNVDAIASLEADFAQKPDAIAFLGILAGEEIFSHTRYRPSKNPLNAALASWTRK